MSQSTVYSIEAARTLKIIDQEERLLYEAQILSMDKVELLEEMMRFQEHRKNEGKLTVKMMIQGKILFSALELNAETEALRLMARSFRRHLDCELEEYIKTGKLPPHDNDDTNEEFNF